MGIRNPKWRGRFGVLTLTCAALTLALASTDAPIAAGQAPGVHIDPGSPAGKEYAIPLNQARSDATPSARGGHSGTGGPSSGSSLFGQGIQPPANSGHANDGPQNGGQGASGAHAGSSASASVGGASGGRRSEAGVVSLPAAASTGRVDTGLPFILATAVLATGCLSGLAIRMLRRRRS